MYDFEIDTSNDYVIPNVSIITDDVITYVLIPEEFLHDPSTHPSKHLNATVSVQDKDKESHVSVRCTVGRAVLDTANYSDDFISFNMIVKLNAILKS